MTNNPFPQPISEEIWNRKYKLTTPNPDIQDDLSVVDTWNRIATACSKADITLTGDKEGYQITQVSRDNWRERYFEALSDFKFLPAGRITAGAGSGRAVTLFNCYVMGTIGDDLDSIFTNLKEAALTMQQGGGIGYDFSPIRPSGAPVKGVDADASGPLSFMDVWDAMCRTIMSAGARRGAMMATIMCSHPDVLKFIKAKREKGRLNMFNMSVMASDDFMNAVIHNYEWPLSHVIQPKDTSLGQTENGEWIYEIVQARDLWNEIMDNTYNHAEPGVLFIDRINKMNNLWYIEDISSTNPCGEQPLPPYGACLLGSINLSRMVKNPFENNAEIDYELIQTTTRIAVRLLDSVIDSSNFPLPEQEAEAKYKRRMGLGITGLADMLFMLNEKYGSTTSQQIADEVMKTITLAAYHESVQMAREYGPCPATMTFDQRKEFVRSGFMSQEGIPSSLRDEIMQHGIRNALLTSIAPTGTISMYAGNVSSGVEPVFAGRYMRNVLEDDGVTKVEQMVEDYGVLRHREWCESTGRDLDPNPEHLVTAQTLTPNDHLVIQAAVQKWIDSSISKTINCPVDISFEDFKEVYMQAYRLGLKGCTTYRPNDTLGSVISIIEDEKSEPEEETLPEEPETNFDTPRAKILDGQTYKLKWQGSNFYVTINNRMQNGKVTPFEIFINTQDMSHFQWTVALTRMMSSVFRRNDDISFVIEDLKSIMDPNGGAFVDGRYQPSFIALLGSTLEQHLKDLKIVDEVHDEIVTDLGETREETLDRMLYLKDSESEVLVYDDPKDQPGHYIDKSCPECKAYTMVNHSGCLVCTDCGYSKCG